MKIACKIICKFNCNGILKWEYEIISKEVNKVNIKIFQIKVAFKEFIKQITNYLEW